MTDTQTSWYDRIACALGLHQWQTTGRKRGDFVTNEPLGRGIHLDDYKAREQTCRHCEQTRFAL